MAMKRLQARADAQTADCEVSEVPGMRGVYWVRIGTTRYEVKLRDAEGARGLWVDGDAVDCAIDEAQLAALRRGEAQQVVFGERAVEAAVTILRAAAGAGSVNGTAPAGSKKRNGGARAKRRTGAVPGAQRAMMPGQVLRVLVEEGQRVEQGTILLVVEAMKMENELRADVAGIVASVDAKAGDRVGRGDLLVRIDAVA